MLAQHGTDAAVAVLRGELLIHQAVAELALVAPAAFLQPQLALHHELHAVDVSKHGWVADHDRVHVLQVAQPRAAAAEHHHAHELDREDQDVVPIDRISIAIEDDRRATY